MLDQHLLMKLLFFAINKNNRFGFTFDISAANLLKAAQGYLSLLGQFDDGTEVVTRVINKSVAYAQQNIARVTDEQSKELEPYESLEILSTWFDKMSRNDPWLISHLIGEYVT